MRIDWQFPSPIVLDLLDVSLILLTLVLFIMVLLLSARAKKAVKSEATAHAPEAGEAGLPKEGNASEESATQGRVADEQQVSQQQPATLLRDLSPDAALQVLSLLQQEARLIDFLSEDLAGHGDADIGAVARVVHEGGRRVLENYFVLAPIRAEDEESRIEVPTGFDAQSIRLTGNVTGQPPYTGTLTHRGWRVSEVKLPKLSEGHEAAIIAPAEVEV